MMKKNTPTSISIFRRGIMILAVLASVYIGLLLFLWLFENQLVYPGSKYPSGNWNPTAFSYEEVTFLAEDGTELVGWFLPALRPDQDLIEIETILLFHGNAENVAQSAGYLGQLLRKHLGAEVFVFDYRGYGKSQGTPNQDGLLLDSKSALKWLMERTEKTPDQIIFAGHSLGGGPACYLAATFGCKGLILDRTFSSLVEAAQFNYPIFPVELLMQNRFPSKDWIAHYHGPVFIAHGTDDRLIPIEQARALFAAAPTDDKVLLEIDGWGHWDRFDDDYWRALKSFYQNSILATQVELR